MKKSMPYYDFTSPFAVMDPDRIDLTGRQDVMDSIDRVHALGRRLIDQGLAETRALLIPVENNLFRTFDYVEARYDFNGIRG